MSQARQPRILVVGAQHGDERLGPRLHAFLKNDTSGRFVNVDYLCGNPRAYRRNVRFTETDLNRSYGADSPESYEQRRAQKILCHIKLNDYDFVLDIHTSRADVGRFFLAAGLTDPVRQVVRASNFSRIAIMSPRIADCSLIGSVPQAVSVEYARPLARTRQALLELVDLLDNLLACKTTALEREIFFVSDLIPQDSGLTAADKNFELCKSGFYPVIFKASGGSYKSYCGFAANKKEVRVI